MLDSSKCSAQLGLRARKKEQTRRRIIDVALTLCDANGFEATTVEQIAAAADVSPRTVNRYFDLKEDIVLAPIREWGRAVAEQLRKIPVTGNELLALRAAYLTVAEDSATDGPVPFGWMQKMQGIVRASPAVRARSIDFADTKTVELNAVVAERLAADPDSLQVRLVTAIWHAILRTGMACELPAADCDTASSPEAGIEAVLSAYEEFIRLCALPLADAATITVEG